MRARFLCLIISPIDVAACDRYISSTLVVLLTFTSGGCMAAESAAKANLTAAQVEKALRGLDVKLARQRQAVADTEAHILALKSLIGSK